MPYTYYPPMPTTEKILRFAPCESTASDLYIMFDGDLIIGELVEEVDGDFYFYPVENGGSYQGWVLEQIAAKLKELNSEQ